MVWPWSLLAACTAPPESVALGDADPRFAELTSWTEARMEEWSVPGVGLAVLEGGEVRHLAGLGVRAFGLPNAASADPVSPDRVTPDTLFRIGSLSKMVAGAALAEEVAAGRIDLDAPASVLLGDIPLAAPHTLESVTLGQVMSHTSGIESLGLSRTCDPDPAHLTEALTEMSQDWAMWTPPGELYHYSNNGYALLGLAAERSAGVEFPTLAQGLFDGAGMTTATYDWVEAYGSDHATGHTMDVATGRPLSYRGLEERACVVGFPPGGVMASARDVAQQVRVLLNGGEGWVSPAAWELMTTQGYNRSDTSGYGFGLQSSSYRGFPSYTHHGSVGGFFAMVWAVPSEGLGVVVLLNSDHNVVDPPEPWSKPTQRIIEHALDLFLELEPEERVSSARPVEEWGRYVGAYHSDYDLGDVSVTLDGETLLYTDAEASYPLFTYSRDSFLYGIPQDDGRTRYVGVGFEEGTAEGDDPDLVKWLVTDTGIGQLVTAPAARPAR
ncbi:MAG: serine hydrolase domain-containing protein [Pseudomonadota bacterium]|nr:serine hydrolase domain-containing protein [Pseudomonadota bacterium]